tara:strand:+ start:85 stop:492 length:408 start_codon:yes stop_codon:yes gene_type:complete
MSVEKKINITKFALVRVSVREENLRDYQEIADQTDMAIKENEKGVIYHQFTKDPSNRDTFNWVVLFTNLNSLLSYFNSPIIALYKANHEALGISYNVEFFGTYNDEEMKQLVKLELPSRINQSIFGYDRVLNETT